jgi:hypothetical protein
MESLDSLDNSTHLDSLDADLDTSTLDPHGVSLDRP